MYMYVRYLLDIAVIYPLTQQHFDPRSQRTSFAALEIHVVPKICSDSESVAMYRVFSHAGQLEKKDAMVNSCTQTSNPYKLLL